MSSSKLHPVMKRSRAKLALAGESDCEVSTNPMLSLLLHRLRAGERHRSMDKQLPHFVVSQPISALIPKLIMKALRTEPERIS